MGAPDPNAKPKPPPPGERETRLAKALRDNLRRRKAAKPAADPSADE
jgi:hypothetical protein